MSKKQHTDKIIRDKLKQHASPMPSHLWEGIESVLDDKDLSVRDKLNQYASPVPVNMWENIDAALNGGKKKPKAAFWWWTGGAAALLLLLAMWSLWPQPSTQVTDEPNATEQSNDSNTSMSLTPATKVETDEKATIENDESDVALTETQNNSTSTVSSDATQTSNRSVANTSDDIYNSGEAVNSAVLVDEGSESVTKETAGSLPLKEDAEEVIDEEIAVVKESTVGLQLHPKSMLLDDESLTELDWPALINKDPKCARFGKWLKLYFYGDAYFSPDFAFRTLKPKGVDYFEYSQTREETESPGFSFSTGMRFSVVSNYGWAVRSGLVYSQINEKFDYQNESEQRITIVTQYDEMGNAIGQDTLIEFGARFKTTYNHYKMIDIPVIIGYEVNLKEKLTLSFNSGVYLNILSRQKGDFLSPNYQLVSFSSEEENPYPAFKNRLNLSVYGSVGVMYGLTDRWQLMLEPHIRYYVDPLTNNNYMVEQSYFSTGLITGLRYKF